MLENSTIECPRGDGNGVFTIDLAKIVKAECRRDEIPIVTVAKALELMSFFNKEYVDLFQIVGDIARQLKAAENRLDKLHGELLIKSEAVLASKNIKSTKELREAVVDSDQQYFDLKEVVAEIRATYTYMQGKMLGFLNDHNSIKKWLGAKENPNQTFNSPGYPEEVKSGLKGFGRAR